MIPQNQRTTGRSNSGRQADATQRNYNRIPIISDVLDMFSGGGGSQPEMQTTTQQNLPNWAIPDAMSTLSMGNYYTQNPDYRASTLDRDYSGLRGYDSMGQPNSQVGQFGLNPSGYTTPTIADPSNNSTTQRQYGTGLKFADEMPQSELLGTAVPPTLGRNAVRTYETSPGPTTGGPKGYTTLTGSGDSYTVRGTSGGTESSGVVGTSADPSVMQAGLDYLQAKKNKPKAYNAAGEEVPVVWDDKLGKWLPQSIYENAYSGDDSLPGTSSDDTSSIFNPDDLTPFQAYDRQRFAVPGQDTLRGEGILSGRYNQRFGPGGTDPFAAANAAVGTAANYQSGFQGTTGGIGGQAGNYQTGLANASNPGVFQSGNYTSNLPNYANPNAGMQSTQFGNANAGLTGPQNYNQNFQNLVNQSMNPYQDQVVNQTISDLDRARRMTQNEIGGQAAKAGAFGGSRQALLEAENNRNYLDRVAAATGQLRQQGFESAANRASQENLQRLGLTAQDLQQTRGLASQGNLAAQGLTAQDAQNVRGLQSQGNLAALNANAGLFQNALGLNAAADRSAMGYNAGLLSDAMGLDAADLNQRRNLASTEAQFAETANRGAGALNLQGGTALGQLAQTGTADERQRIADMLAAGGAGDARNQQDLDFIYNEFNRELQYPGQQIDLRNAAISPATGSIVTTTQPQYQSNPLLGGLGAGVSTYAMTSNPWLAGAAGLLSYLNR